MQQSRRKRRAVVVFDDDSNILVSVVESMKRILLLSLLGSYIICQTYADGEGGDEFTYRYLQDGFLNMNNNRRQSVESASGCYGELITSDTNNDLALTSDEYTDYLAVRSGGVIDVPYQELPLSLISNFVFTACQCSLIFREPNCCVGENTMITLDLEVSPLVTNSINSFCELVDSAILEEGGILPTASPTLSPTISSTGPPTTQPSEIPSIEPTEAPATSTPSTSPTDSPTNAPVEVTPAPATPAPTTLAPITIAPSNSPTTDPTSEPTVAPITTAPTSMPTLEALTCINFQYGIVNSVGITAQDIFNEVNNTLKTGLIIATRNITIEILNETYPRDQEEEANGRLRKRQLQQGGDDGGWKETLLSFFFLHDDDSPQTTTSTTSVTNKDNWGQNFQADSGKNSQTQTAVYQSERRNVYRLEDKPFSDMIVDGRTSRSNYGMDDLRTRRLPYLGSYPTTYDGAVDEQGRRLVFYTDDFLPQIPAIFDNPFCEKPTPETECAIVVTVVCVVLEEGDDEAEVQNVLLNGFEVAILNGDFEAAIPPEHALPSERMLP